MKKCLIPFKFSINILLFSLIIFKIIYSECPENLPILKNNNCESTYCTESEFKSNVCSINNTKIKTQWLTNIIIFGDNNARFINFANFSNGDFVVEATPCKLIKTIRYFFGLKNNGRDLFKVNNKETQFYYFEPVDEDNSGKKYQGEIQIAKMNEESNKEYLLSLTKATSYAELYDFENGVMYKKKMNDLFGKENQNQRQASLVIKCTDNKYYSIYGFIEGSEIYLYKFSLNTKTSIESSSKLSPKKKSDAKGENVSCFETTTNKRIVCFYYSEKDTGKPAVYILNQNLEQEGYNYIDFNNYYNQGSFIKCIHYKDEIGVFSFYDYDSHNNIYPYVYFIEIKSDGLLSNPMPNLPQHSILNYTKFDNRTLMNDLTKISDTKICFTATLQDHETIFIIIYHIISTEKIKIRYYSFPIFQFRNYKILSDMKSFSYNQFAAVAASVCNQTQCYNDHEDYHYSSLIIFSYPNSTDEVFDISEELLKDNEKKIEKLEIDLKKYTRIENNIFGYVFKKIQMNNIICTKNYMKLYSTKGNLPINGDYSLGVDENIRIIFEDENIYSSDNCSFEYKLFVIEPDRDEYDSYVKHIDLYAGDDTESEFNSMKTPLVGRTSYFNITLKTNLIKNCSQINCDLCLESSPNICITCKNELYFDFIDGTTIKKCNYSLSELYTTIIETTQPEISTTEPEISTTEPEISTTQPEISTTQPQIPQTFPHISPAQPQIPQTQPQIQKIETTQIVIDSTPKEEDLETQKQIQIAKTENIIEQIEESTKIGDNCSEGSNNSTYNNGSVTENQSEELYKKFKEDCLNIECASQNKIVEIDNIIYQISTLEAIKNSNNPNVSSIDLGDCEDRLRKENNMTAEDEFIIYKKDIKDGLTTYVEYEIYDKVLKLVNLDICKDTQITIDIPVNLVEETQLLYDKMNQLGYNLFDSSDSFYHDICATFTSESGTDMLLSDRKQDIFKKN